MKVVIDIPEIPTNDKQRWALANGTPYEERPHGEWISKPKRIQVDETDEERIFETRQEWFCSSCGKSFGFRKPEDAFCKYCGSDNRPRENNSSSMIINGKYSENVEYGTRVEIRKKGGE